MAKYIKQRTHFRGALLSTTALVSLTASLAIAEPQGGTVVAGSAEIRTPDASTTVINQSTNRAIIDWQSFDTRPDESVLFEQPDSDAVTLNRVVGRNGPTDFSGTLMADGTVVIVNQDGVVFGNGAQIDVGSLIATTADIENEAFMSGAMDFRIPGTPGATVRNAGSITAKEGGLVALVAPSAINDGQIVARIGRVAVAGADTFSISFADDDFIQLMVAEGHPAHRYLSENNGEIEAAGGAVMLSVGQARSVAEHSLVNNTGLVEATSIERSGGRVFLGGGPKTTVRNSGTVRSRGEVGGEVIITAERVEIVSSSEIDASGRSGGGTVQIGGDYLGGNAALAALNPLAPRLEEYPVYNATTTLLESGAQIRADAVIGGDGGKVIVWSDEYTAIGAEISARGGLSFGDGGFVETSGGYLDLRSAPDVGSTNGAGGTWLIDPRDIEIVEGVELFDDINISGGALVPAQDASQLGVFLINTRLNNGTSVVVTNAGSSGNDDGDITIAADISKMSGGNADLTIFTENDLIIQRDVNITSSSGELNFSAVVNNEVQAGRMGDLELNGGQLRLITGDDILLATDSDMPDEVVIRNVLDRASSTVDVELEFGSDDISFSYTSDEIEIRSNGIRIRDGSNRSLLEIDLAGSRRDLILHDRAIQAPESFEWEIPSNTLRTRSTVAEDANNGIAEVIGDPDTSFFKSDGVEPDGTSIGLIEVSFDDGTETDRVFVTTDGGAAVLVADNGDGSDGDGGNDGPDIVVPDDDPTLPGNDDDDEPDPADPDQGSGDEPTEPTDDGGPTQPDDDDDSGSDPDGSGGDSSDDIGGGGSTDDQDADQPDISVSFDLAFLDPEFPLLVPTTGGETTPAVMVGPSPSEQVAAIIREKVLETLNGVDFETLQRVRFTLDELEEFAMTLPESERRQFMWDATSMVIGLTGIGTPISAVMDVGSAGYSAVDGRFVDAGLGGLAIVPFVGDVGSFVGKYGPEGSDAIAIIASGMGKQIDESSTVLPDGSVRGNVNTSVAADLGAPIREFPDGSFRTPDGKFASQGGLPAPGTRTAQEYTQFLMDKGFDVVGEELTVRGVVGTRRYDAVLRADDGGLWGIEYKSGGARKTTQQDFNDMYINRVGADGIGQLAGQRVVGNITIYLP